MDPIPKNLFHLHEGEEQMRERALELIRADEELPAHLDVMERAMDLLDVFVRLQIETTDDCRAIQHFAIRVFNGFACAWKLTAAGYHQKAAMVQRDLIETVYLVNYFHIHAEKISVWRMADRKQLLNEFGPGQIRKALDAHAGLGKSRREEIYQKFCSLAAHPTKAGFDMLRPKGGDGAVLGPFMDKTALKALLEEQGQLAIQAGFAFALFLDMELPVANATLHRFMLGAMDYSGRFLGKAYTAEERSEVDRLYSVQA